MRPLDTDFAEYAMDVHIHQALITFDNMEIARTFLMSQVKVYLRLLYI